jgi:hypothetical protein
MLGSGRSYHSTPQPHKVFFSLYILFHLRKCAVNYNNVYLFCRYTLETYPNINSVWTAFENTLIAGSGIITYAPIFTDYFYQGLQSFYDDNVQYIEIRTTLPQVCLISTQQQIEQDLCNLS